MQVSIAGNSRLTSEVRCFSLVVAIDHFLKKLQDPPAAMGRLHGSPTRIHQARAQEINTNHRTKVVRKDFQARNTLWSWKVSPEQTRTLNPFEDMREVWLYKND